MNRITATNNVWAPPAEDAAWFVDPLARANHLAALERHNEHTFREAVDFLDLWRREVSCEPMTPAAVEDRSDTEVAELIAALVRIAHNRGRLGRDVAGSFKHVAAAVGVSAERLSAAVHGALDSELAA